MRRSGSIRFVGSLAEVDREPVVDALRQLGVVDPSLGSVSEQLRQRFDQFRLLPALAPGVVERAAQVGHQLDQLMLLVSGQPCGVRSPLLTDVHGQFFGQRADQLRAALSDDESPLFDGSCMESMPVALPTMPDHIDVRTDYATIGLSLKRHPVSFAREDLSRLHIATAAEAQDATRHPDGKLISVCGLVLVRQRPGTASGVVFFTLEDETGIVNLIAWSRVYERYRRAARHATLLQAIGHIQRQGQVLHIVVKKMIDRSPLLPELSQASRDFH